jgi:hypothetical protein
VSLFLQRVKTKKQRILWFINVVVTAVLAHLIRKYSKDDGSDDAWAAQPEEIETRGIG